MPAVNPVTLNIRALAHYLDQPQVIDAAHKLVSKRGGLWAFTGGLLAYDLLTAEPGKRKDVLVRDALVLGSTAATTKVGLNILAEQSEMMPPINQIQGFEKEFKAYPKAFVNKYFNRVVALPSETHEKAYVPKGQHHAHFNQSRGYFKLSEIKDMIRGAKKYGGKKADTHLGKIFPLPGGHDHSKIGKMFLNLVKKGQLPQMKHLKALAGDDMVKFFFVGGMIVVAGLVGGLIYNAVAGIKDEKAKVNQIKEGIFQFIANIAMCAVGATVGLTVADALELEQKASKFPAKAMTYRASRFALILSGLSIGIVGGGFIANWFGRRFVNPFFRWLDHKHEGMTLGEALKNPMKKSDRKVEFMDAILHLDDLPTALALSGVQIFVPFIPLFFAVSGWRTGLGYRNKGHAHGGREWMDEQPMPYQKSQSIQRPLSTPTIERIPPIKSISKVPDTVPRPLSPAYYPYFQANSFVNPVQQNYGFYAPYGTYYPSDSTSFASPGLAYQGWAV